MENFPKVSRRLFFKSIAYGAATVALVKSMGQKAWAAATASDAKILAKPASANQAYRRISLTNLPSNDKDKAVVSKYEGHVKILDGALTKFGIQNTDKKILPQCANCLQYKNPQGEYGTCAMVGALMKAPELVGAHQTGWCKIYAVNQKKEVIEASAKIN